MRGRKLRDAFNRRNQLLPDPEKVREEKEKKSQEARRRFKQLLDENRISEGEYEALCHFQDEKDQIAKP